MTRVRMCVWIVISVAMVTAPGCKCEMSTANISGARMAKDSDGNQPATVFSPTDAFYCVLELANAPDDTTLKAVWTAVDVEGTEPNHQIEETEVTSGSAPVNFKLTNTAPWPPGKYKVDLYLNGKLDQTLTFTVEGGGD